MRLMRLATCRFDRVLVELVKIVVSEVSDGLVNKVG